MLIIASLIFGLALAVTDAAWSPKIEQNRIDKLFGLMKGLLNEADNFELILKDVSVELIKGKKARCNIYKALSADGVNMGWAFNAQGSGFADKIELVIAVDGSFEKLAGYDVLASNETPGFGDQIKLDYYKSQFQNVPAARLKLSKTGDYKILDSQIVAISGATVSSQAVVDILNNYIRQIRKRLQTEGLIEDGK